MSVSEKGGGVGFKVRGIILVVSQDKVKGKQVGPRRSLKPAAAWGLHTPQQTHTPWPGKLLDHRLWTLYVPAFGAVALHWFAAR